MKRIAIKALAILVAVGFVACLQSNESSFFRSFSLRKIVAASISSAGLEDGTGGGGGSGSISAGGWGFGSREFHSHKGDACFFKVKPDAVGVFDETAFIAGLAQEVERALISSGATIIESGKIDSTSFYFGYALDNTKGRVEISGRKDQANYILQANLEESGKVKSW